ncbi:hypothetical protein [Moorena bouillonii]|uniref:hypothetical protein n=1 Tax=Moorena bouillonii TaxID=207920 RepID=UPI00117C079F|nr:hypothetical protein [Moorena bouillonii]
MTYSHATRRTLGHAKRSHSSKPCVKLEQSNHRLVDHDQLGHCVILNQDWVSCIYIGLMLY